MKMAIFEVEILHYHPNIRGSLQSFTKSFEAKSKAEAKRIAIADYLSLLTFSLRGEVIEVASVKPLIDDAIIDRRLEFLYQRREAARKAYMEPDWDDPKEWLRTRNEYHTAIEAYIISSERYGRHAPSLRDRCKRYEPI